MPKYILSTRLSAVATAVIITNAAFISNNTFADEITSLPTVIVTGEKVDRDIKDTTTAVTIYSEEDYANGAITDINDIATQVPNIETTGFGGISIRGVNGVGASTGSNAYMTGASPRLLMESQKLGVDTTTLLSVYGIHKLLKYFAVLNLLLKAEMPLVGH